MRREIGGCSGGTVGITGVDARPLTDGKVTAVIEQSTPAGRWPTRLKLGGDPGPVLLRDEPPH